MSDINSFVNTRGRYEPQKKTYKFAETVWWTRWYSYGFSCYCFSSSSSSSSSLVISFLFIVYFLFRIKFVSFSFLLFFYLLSLNPFPSSSIDPIYMYVDILVQAVCVYARAQKTPESCSLQFGFCLIMTNVVLFGFHLLTFAGHLFHRQRDELSKQIFKHRLVSFNFCCCFSYVIVGRR